MKKVLALLLAAILILSLAACGSQNSAVPQNTQSSAKVAEPSAADTAAQAEQPDDPSTTEQREAPETQGTEADGKDNLIVYFSPANSDGVDGVSAATPRVGDVSSVEYVAQLIGARVDADMAKIVPATAYPLPYNDAADQAKKERDDGARPAFTLDVNPEDYDVIFVGYPMWWYEMPMIMDTFFDTYDFSGKTIIPFNTHAGSRDGGTYKDIAALEPNATVLDGLAVSGERAGSAEGDVNDWLTRLGY